MISRRLITDVEKGEISISVEHSSETLNSRFAYLQTIIDHYWNRFSKEYLLELHQHHLSSCKRNYDEFSWLVLGDVLLKDDAFNRKERKGRAIDIW